MSEGGKLVALVFEESGEYLAVYGAQGESSTGGAVAVTHPYQAQASLDEIKAKAKEAGVELKDAVIAYKTGDGQVKIEQTKDLTAGKGAGRGTFWGFLVGLIFGGPLLGALGGFAIGALMGKRTDKGLDDQFIRDVAASLKPGKSALLLMIERELSEDGIAYLESFNAKLFVTDVSAETESAVTEAASDENVAKAVAAEVETD
jgi:uncharacterized membrane protein